MERDVWLSTSATIVGDGKAWRTASPKATCLDREDEVHRRMVQVEAQRLGVCCPRVCTPKQTGEGAPRCPTRPGWHGMHEASRSARDKAMEESVRLLRTDGTCPNCGESLFPLDGECALLPDTRAPRQDRHLVLLARWMPCRHARRILAERLGVSVSPATARRLCEDVGSRVEEQHAVDAHAPWSDVAKAPEKRCRMAISADGAMVLFPEAHGGTSVHVPWERFHLVSLIGRRVLVLVLLPPDRGGPLSRCGRR